MTDRTVKVLVFFLFPASHAAEAGMGIDHRSGGVRRYHRPAGEKLNRAAWRRTPAPEAVHETCILPPATQAQG